MRTRNYPPAPRCLRRSFIVSTFVFTALGLMPLPSLAQTNYTPYAFITLVGGGGFSTNVAGSAARLWAPSAVAVDSAGNLYVPEQANNCLRKVTPAGTVTILAGQPGNYGWSDGIGRAGQFMLPSGVAVDVAGNVYVADAYAHTIRKVTPTGVVTTLAGSPGNPGSANGTGSVARFNGPSGLATDSAGNVYVADTFNYTIRKVTPAGVVSTLAGSRGNPGSADGTGSAARFDGSFGLAVDRATNIYVADAFNHTVRKMTLVGVNWVVTTLAGSAGSSGRADGTNSNARFSEPNGVALDSAGNLFVAEYANCTIRKMTPEGGNWIVTTVAGSAGSVGSLDGRNSEARFNAPTGLAVGGAGSLYVADAANNLIRKLTPEGTNWVVSTFAGIGEGHGSTDGSMVLTDRPKPLFYGPSGVAVTSGGLLYVADQINATIRAASFGRYKEVTTLVGLAGQGGSADGAGNNARFRNGAGIAVDPAGNVYVADAGNSTIRKVKWDGITNWVVTTIAGQPGVFGGDDGVGSHALFGNPQGVTLDDAGNLYVADTWGHTIRRLTPSGSDWAVTTLAGQFDYFGIENGTGSNAQFHFPTGVAVDSSKNVYVADSGNHVIRKVTPAGVVTTLAGSPRAAGSADGTGSAARFDTPSGVAVDAAGNVYVADTYNNSIRKVTPAGVVTTLGGMPGFIGTDDGAGSAARFSNPTGIAVDADGSLYVADFYSNRIRKGYPPTAKISGVGFEFVGFNRYFHFTVYSPPGLSTVVEASHDLVSWLRLGTNSTGTFYFYDPPSDGSSKRFYRARMP